MLTLLDFYQSYHYDSSMDLKWGSTKRKENS